MTFTAEDVATLRARLNTGAERDGDLREALATADAHLAVLVGTVAVPGVVLREQLLDVAGRVFRLRSSESGSAESPHLDPDAATLSVDPLYAARRNLRQWLGGGIG